MRQSAASGALQADVLIAGACIALFALLAIAVSTGMAAPFDDAVRAAVHTAASPSLTTFFQTISLLGSVAVILALTAVAVLVLFALGQRRTALSLALTMGAVFLLNNLLKYAFERMRPLPFFGAAPESYSFPSGHAAYASCFYVSVAIILASHVHNPGRRAAILAIAIVLALLIGVSRIYLGVHYPTDVIAGFLVAIFLIAVTTVADSTFRPQSLN